MDILVVEQREYMRASEKPMTEIATIYEGTVERWIVEIPDSRETGKAKSVLLVMKDGEDKLIKVGRVERIGNTALTTHSVNVGVKILINGVVVLNVK